MIAEAGVLVTLLRLVDRMPLPAPRRAHRGRLCVYADRLFLKALLIMLVRRLPRVQTLLAMLTAPTAELQPLRGLLGVLAPWRDAAPAAAIDSTALPARGGVWHKQHRQAGIVPYSSIDTDPALPERCAAAACELGASKRGAYPHRDGGVAVRRLFQQLRSRAIENVNRQFTASFAPGSQVPTRGLCAMQRYVLGVVLVCHLTLLARFEAGAARRCRLLAYLRAA